MTWLLSSIRRVGLWKSWKWEDVALCCLSRLSRRTSGFTPRCPRSHPTMELKLLDKCKRYAYSPHVIRDRRISTPQALTARKFRDRHRQPLGVSAKSIPAAAFVSRAFDLDFSDETNDGSGRRTLENVDVPERRGSGPSDR